MQDIQRNMSFFVNKSSGITENMYKKLKNFLGIQKKDNLAICEMVVNRIAINVKGSESQYLDK